MMAPNDPGAEERSNALFNKILRLNVIPMVIYTIMPQFGIGNFGGVTSLNDNLFLMHFSLIFLLGLLLVMFKRTREIGKALLISAFLIGLIFFGTCTFMLTISRH
jgi:RsiW-degrading membrane proteinase PrsW (M82 family)